MHGAGHWSFPDPSSAIGDEQERLATFRQVRDSIARRIEQFLSEAPL